MNHPHSLALHMGVATLTSALAACDRRAWPGPAPACGLTLVRVEYDGEAE